MGLKASFRRKWLLPQRFPKCSSCPALHRTVRHVNKFLCEMKWMWLPHALPPDCSLFLTHSLSPSLSLWRTVGSSYYGNSIFGNSSWVFGFLVFCWYFSAYCSTKTLLNLIDLGFFSSPPCTSCVIMAVDIVFGFWLTMNLWLCGSAISWTPLIQYSTQWPVIYEQDCPKYCKQNKLDCMC